MQICCKTFPYTWICHSNFYWLFFKFWLQLNITHYIDSCLLITSNQLYSEGNIFFFKNDTKFFPERLLYNITLILSLNFLQYLKYA